MNLTSARPDSSFGSILDSTVVVAGWARGDGGRGVGGQQLKSYNFSGDTMAPEACSTSN